MNQTGYLVGYGRADITPQLPVRMLGRQATGIQTSLYADSIAVTGTNSQTALIITVDTQNVPTDMMDEIRLTMEKELDIPRELIQISATHTHTAPAQYEGSYSHMMFSGIFESAKAALADRAPGEMYVATVRTKGLNFDRNYLMNDGTYAGSCFGSYASGFKAHESEVDPDLLLIKFKREGAKDILISNFCAHPHRDYNLPQYNTLLSANVPYFFRKELEEKLGCHVAYFTGASGNVNMNTRIPEEETTTDMVDQGKAIARYAISAENRYTKLEAGPVLGKEITVACKVDHSRDHLCQVALDTQKVAKEQGMKEAKAYALEHGLVHFMEAKAILSKAEKGEYMHIPVGVVSIGEAAFAAGSYEMYNANGTFIKENSPFAMTFVLYLCNGNYAYMPNDICFDHGGYGVYACRYIRGTAEQLADAYVDLLDQLHRQKEELSA